VRFNKDQMASGYSTNPLYKKLGLKVGFRLLIIGNPQPYKAFIGAIDADLLYQEHDGLNLDFVHLFTNSVTELTNLLPGLKTQIKKDGMIWVSWYKKSARKETELNEHIIRETALSTGLVDVKVCAVDETWSGLKLVFRLKDR
jgi:hypothetical protein